MQTPIPCNMRRHHRIGTRFYPDGTFEYEVWNTHTGLMDRAIKITRANFEALRTNGAIREVEIPYTPDNGWKVWELA